MDNGTKIGRMMGFWQVVAAVMTAELLLSLIYVTVTRVVGEDE